MGATILVETTICIIGLLFSLLKMAASQQRILNLRIPWTATNRPPPHQSPMRRSQRELTERTKPQLGETIDPQIQTASADRAGQAPPHQQSSSSIELPRPPSPVIMQSSSQTPQQNAKPSDESEPAQVAADLTTTTPATTTQKAELSATFVSNPVSDNEAREREREIEEKKLIVEDSKKEEERINKVAPLTVAEKGKENEEQVAEVHNDEQDKKETEGVLENHSTSSINGQFKKASLNGEEERIANTTPAHTKPEGEKICSIRSEISDDASKFVDTIEGHLKQVSDKRSIFIITLAGENKGASMNLCSESPRNNGPVRIHRGNRITLAEATCSNEEESTGKNQHLDRTSELDSTMHININTQGINNSILFSSSMSERNPGVHLVIPHTGAEAVSRNNTRPNHSSQEDKLPMQPQQHK